MKKYDLYVNGTYWGKITQEVAQDKIRHATQANIYWHWTEDKLIIDTHKKFVDTVFNVNKNK